MSFIETYERVLSPYVKEFGKANNEKVRKLVIKNAADAVVSSKDLFEEKGEELPKDLKTAISRYLKKKSSAKEGAAEAGVKVTKARKMRRSYTFRDVVKHIFGDKVDLEIPYDRKDKGYISCYQKAVTSVLENLTQEEREEAEELLESWNKEKIKKAAGPL